MLLTVPAVLPKLILLLPVTCLPAFVPIATLLAPLELPPATQPILILFVLFVDPLLA